MYSTRFDDYSWLMLLTGNVQSPWKKYNQYHDQHLLTAVTDFIRQQPWQSDDIEHVIMSMKILRNLRIWIFVWYWWFCWTKEKVVEHVTDAHCRSIKKLWSFAIYSRSFCLYRKWSRVRDVMITSYCKLFVYHSYILFILRGSTWFSKLKK